VTAAVREMTEDAADRVAHYAWPAVAEELDAFGGAVLPGLLILHDAA
jgi:hypothetical protein